MGQVQAPWPPPPSKHLSACLRKPGDGVDAKLLVNLLNQFDELRIERLPVAQKFLAAYNSDDELFADLANILALLYAANKVMQIPQGFKSDTGG